MKRIAVASAVALVVSASVTLAQGMSQSNMPKDHKMDGMKDMASSPSATAGTHKGTGVVKKSDAARGMVTLDHEPVASMKWPAMSMEFEVADKKMLENVKPGTSTLR